MILRCRATTCVLFKRGISMLIELGMSPADRASCDGCQGCLAQVRDSFAVRLNFTFR